MKNLIIFFIAGIAGALATGCGTQQPSAPQSAGLAVNVLVRPEVAGKASEMPAQKAVDLGGGTRLEMVLIPAGSFLMGDNTGLDDEKPAHKVTITKPFYLGQYEVTVEQFRKFVEATGYATDAEKGTGFQGAFGWNRDMMEFQMNDEYSWRNTGFAQLDTHPVVNVSWNDAMEFCRWLSRKEGSTFRLPTEAEWEYACRAGTTTPYFHGHDPEGTAQVGNVADAAFAAQFPELESAIKPVTVMRIRRLLGVFRRTHLACTTCMEMSGSGVRTGSTWNTMRTLRRTTRRGLPLARNACTAAAAGSTAPRLPIREP